jgi:hypothetical protein
MPRRGPWNEKPSEDLSFDFQVQNPAHARAGFLLFVDGIPSSGEQFCWLFDGTCFNIHGAILGAPLPLKGAKSGRSHCTLHVTAAFAGREAGNHGHKKIATA